MLAWRRFGWLMFMLSGLFFLVSAIRSRDWLTICGVAVWLIGCTVFLLEDSEDDA